MTLPKTVNVAGVTLARLGLRMDYVGSSAHCMMRVHKQTLHWRGEAYGYKRRGTRGEIRVRTLGTYTCPRRCADALTRLVHGWNLAGYVT